MLQNLKITNGHIWFADIKSQFLFSDDSSENLYQQNDDVPIDHFVTNFQKKSLDLMEHEKKNGWFKTTQKKFKKKSQKTFS